MAKLEINVSEQWRGQEVQLVQISEVQGHAPTGSLMTVRKRKCFLHDVILICVVHHEGYACHVKSPSSGQRLTAED